MTRTACLAVALTLAVACAPAGQQDLTPRLSGVSAEGDAQLDLVDRESALADALDAEQADLGEALALADAPGAFRLEIEASEVHAIRDDMAQGPPPPLPSFANVLQGIAMTGVAELSVAAIVAPAAAAIHVTAQGQITQVAENIWVATNTVSDGERLVTGRWAVAWVGVGWLAEMRITSSDGAYNNHRWFAGFLSADDNLGWWDVYDNGGNLAGVIEWLADGQGNGEIALIATQGDVAGDTLSFWSLDGEQLVALHDASADDDAWVYVDVDRSGEARAPDFNAGQPGCWAAADAEVPYADVACPE
ncbi:MAG: hypothetical protein H6739_42295 [Alphaproteobacteria bacterium]|nr:hypothetical protein [Alphaproteobacteria bacterium]